MLFLLPFFTPKSVLLYMFIICHNHLSINKSSEEHVDKILHLVHQLVFLFMITQKNDRFPIDSVDFQCTFAGPVLLGNTEVIFLNSKATPMLREIV